MNVKKSIRSSHAVLTEVKKIATPEQLQTVEQAYKALMAAHRMYAIVVEAERTRREALQV